MLYVYFTATSLQHHNFTCASLLLHLHFTATSQKLHMYFTSVVSFPQSSWFSLPSLVLKPPWAPHQSWTNNRGPQDCVINSTTTGDMQLSLLGGLPSKNLWWGHFMVLKTSLSPKDQRKLFVIFVRGVACGNHRTLTNCLMKYHCFTSHGLKK